MTTYLKEVIFTKKASSIQYNAPETRPGLTPETRQNQLIALAWNCAEKQLRDGTASSQIITHLLKMGSLEKQIELEKLRKETILLEAKTESIKAAAQNAASSELALEAFRSYAGAASREEIIYDEGE